MVLHTSMNEIYVFFLLLFLSHPSSHPLFFPLLFMITILCCHPANSLGTLILHRLLSSGDGIFVFCANFWSTVVRMAEVNWSFLPAGGILWCCGGLHGASKAEGREGRSDKKRILGCQKHSAPCPSHALPHLLHRGHQHTVLVLLHLKASSWLPPRCPVHRCGHSRISAMSLVWTLRTHTHHAVAEDHLLCLPFFPGSPLSTYPYPSPRLSSCLPLRRQSCSSCSFVQANPECVPFFQPSRLPIHPALPVTSSLSHSSNLMLLIPLSWIFLPGL